MLLKFPKWLTIVLTTILVVSLAVMTYIFKDASELQGKINAQNSNVQVETKQEVVPVVEVQTEVKTEEVVPVIEDQAEDQNEYEDSDDSCIMINPGECKRIN